MARPEMDSWRRATAAQGPDDLMAAAVAAPRQATPLVVRLAPAGGAGAALGPGWPRALVAAYARAWRKTGCVAAPRPVWLWVDIGAAPGLALAVLADWRAAPSAVPGSGLGLLLDPGLPAAVLSTLRARAEAQGAMVATTDPFVAGAVGG